MPCNHVALMDDGCRTLARTVCVGVLAALVVGCSMADEPRPRSSSAPRPTASANEDRAKTSGRLERLTLGSPDQLSRVPVGLPERVDPAAVVVAPFLHDEPIPTATLALGVSLFGAPGELAAGDVAVLSKEHGWRRVSMAAAGLARTDYTEQQFALSPDGTQLALAEPHRIFVIGLAQASTATFRVPAAEPVGLRWSVGGQAVAFFDRLRPSSSQAGWQLAVLTGRVSPTTVDLNPAVPSGLEDTASTAAIEQRTRFGGAPGSPGVVVRAAGDDPTAVLRLSRSQATWSTVLGWTPGGRVLVAVADGPNGAVVAWDPTAGRAQQIVRLGSRGLLVNAAIELLDP